MHFHSACPEQLWSYSDIETYSFCTQVAQKAVPTVQRITVVAGPGATVRLNYFVPITGTNIDDLGFMIKCRPPHSTSRLPQEGYYTNNSSFQCLAIFVP